jgi:hypothetical protein
LLGSLVRYADNTTKWIASSLLTIWWDDSAIVSVMAISQQLSLHLSRGDQLTFSMSGNFQLLSKMAFSGPYTRNHGNHCLPAWVQSQFDSMISGLVYDVATGLVEVVLPPAPIRTS